jgi:hypothetical protein
MMPLKHLKDLDCRNLLSMMVMQSFLAIAAATARNDPPPSSNRPWAPPNLPKYEAELGGRIGNESGGNEPCRHAGSVMRLDIQQFRRDKCA